MFFMIQEMFISLEILNFFIYIKAFYSFDIICVRNELVYKK